MSSDPYVLTEQMLVYPFRCLGKLYILFSLIPAPHQECNFAEQFFGSILIFSENQKSCSLKVTM